MQSGIMYGAVDAIEGLISRLTKEVFSSASPVVVATGGLARMLIGHTQAFDHVEPALVLRGIILTLYSL
jgi:type III pantothenate kinase